MWTPDAGEGRHCSLPGDSGIPAGDAGADLTASNKRGAIVDAVNAGATGYLQKYSGKEMLLSTVREVAAGEFRVQGETARRLVPGMGFGSGLRFRPATKLKPMWNLHFVDTEKWGLGIPVVAIFCKWRKTLPSL